MMNKNKNHLGKIDTLYSEIRAVLEKARSSAYRAVNFAMVQAYWQIGRLIVENEQKGEERAEYGKAILQGVSNRLLKNTHKILLEGVRGKERFTGKFRKSQNWIGGGGPSDAVFVPPDSSKHKKLHNGG